jgi:hypothetical protein
MVPICVNDPIGLAIPLRMASTPAIVVVLTAPKPTSSTPNFPRAGAISTGDGTGQNYTSFSAFSSRLAANVAANVVADSRQLRAVS